MNLSDRAYMARRHLALVFPRLAIDRLVRREPGLAGAPLILWAQQGPRRVVTAAAAGVPVAPGVPLADALAATPGLLCRPAEPEADEATLASLAAWCLCVTPLAAPSPPDGIALDITGCDHLFGGEAALLAWVTARLGRAGFTVTGAVADTALGAAALARAGHGVVVPVGEQEAAVLPLPLAALRPGEDVLAAAARLGLRRVADIARQPRGPLARRLGPALPALLDQALGRADAPIKPLRPAPPARVARDCPEPIMTAEAIGTGLAALMAELCDDLARRGQGARRLTLSCHRTDATVQRIGIGTGLASRDAAHFTRLLSARIERIDPGFGIERLVLAAEVTEPLGALQAGLPGSGAEAAARREELARLLDRLRERLGPRAVRRLDPFPSHWPEQAVRVADPASPPRPVPEGWGAKPRPVRLARRPRPIAALSLLPDGPPVRLGAARIVAAEGPERILPAWWKAGAQQGGRDYWRVETEDGRRLWVFAARRDGAGPEWFLHGWLA
jgi:protein ImuB